MKLKYAKRFALVGFIFSMGLVFDDRPYSPLHGAELSLRLIGAAAIAAVVALLGGAVGLVIDALISSRKKESGLPPPPPAL